MPADSPACRAPAKRQQSWTPSTASCLWARSNTHAGRASALASAERLEDFVLVSQLNLTLLRQRRATNDYGLALEIVRCSVEVAM